MLLMISKKQVLQIRSNNNIIYNNSLPEGITILVIIVGLLVVTIRIIYKSENYESSGLLISFGEQN